MADTPRITWLGHATFILEDAAGVTVLVDPFVMSNPKCPEDCQSFERLDVIAITHGHQDHVADIARIYEDTQPGAVVAQVEVAAWVRSTGVPDDVVVEMNKGGTVEVDGIAITMVDANHSSGLPTDDGMRYCGEPAGLVFRLGDDLTVYHAGDTNVFGDMALIGELYRPDVALLPIGDHYTMGPREAAKACELLGAPKVIPMHFGTWPVLHGTPEKLRAECAERALEQEVVVLEPGESWRA